MLTPSPLSYGRFSVGWNCPPGADFNGLVDAPLFAEGTRTTGRDALLLGPLRGGEVGHLRGCSSHAFGFEESCFKDRHFVKKGFAFSVSALAFVPVSVFHYFESSLATICRLDFYGFNQFFHLSLRLVLRCLMQ